MIPVLPDWETGCCADLGSANNNGARVASADSEADFRLSDMSLTSHANSVITDNVLTCTVHHGTRRTIGRCDDNIPQHFISFFEDMFRWNVGQIRKDTSSLLDNKFSVSCKQTFISCMTTFLLWITNLQHYKISLMAFNLLYIRKYQVLTQNSTLIKIILKILYMTRFQH